MRALLTCLVLLPLSAIAATRTEEFQREYARALVDAEAGKYADALAALRRARALAPRRMDVLLRMAVLEAETGDWANAERHLKDLLAIEPKNADALRELGALLVLRGRAAEAVPYLEKGAAANPRDGLLRYYLGLSLAAAGRDRDARAALEAAAELEKPLASQAHYQIALSLQRAGLSTRARLALEEAVWANSDPPTVERARAALADLRRGGEGAAKRWNVAVSLGAAYDSNVSLLPDLATDLPLPPGVSLIGADAAVTSAAAGRLYTEIAFEGRPLTGRHAVGLGAGFYQSKHAPETVQGTFEPPAFDMTSFGAYAYYAFAAQAGPVPLRAEMAAGHVEYLLDAFRSPRHYLQRSWARPSLTASYASWGAARVSYQFAGENYASFNPEGSADDRDGFEHLAVIEQFFGVGDAVGIRLAGTVGVFGSDGDQWDAFLAGAALDVHVQAASWFGLSVGTDYLRRSFGNSRYTTTGSDLQARDVQRVDDRIAAYGRLNFRMGRFGLALFYTYMENRSSARAIFSYQRQLAGLEVGFRY